MAEKNKSYQQIIKSTGIFGGSQIVTVVLGIVRNKLLAIWLGAAGIGLISIYQNILDLLRSVAGMGIETGGVREIASVNQSENEDLLIRNVSLIDKVSRLLAIGGMALCILFSYPISLWAFGSGAYVLQVILLSLSVLFSILGAGQMVILHGLRKISHMVKSTVISTAVGLVLTLPLYYFFREKAIIPSLIIAALALHAITLHYRRKLGIRAVKVSYREVFDKAMSIFRLGFYIVVSSTLTLVGYFVVRTFLSSNMGLPAVGLYQAVWSVTGVYLMLILKSMGSDFYPRLCAIIDNKGDTARLINEQSYVVLVVSVPLIVLLLLCSKVVLSLLYSSEFAGATGMMNWQIMGTFFKVLSWPLGFILLAKGKGRLYFFSEMLFLLVYLAFIYLLYDVFSFEAVGIAYLIAYIVYLFAVFVQGRLLCDFGWTRENLSIGCISFILVLSAFGVVQYFSEYTVFVGIPLFIISVLYSLFKLNKVFPVQSLLDMIKRR